MPFVPYDPIPPWDPLCSRGPDFILDKPLEALFTSSRRFLQLEVLFPSLKSLPQWGLVLSSSQTSGISIHFLFCQSILELHSKWGSPVGRKTPSLSNFWYMTRGFSGSLRDSGLLFSDDGLPCPSRSHSWLLQKWNMDSLPLTSSKFHATNPSS